MLEGVQWLIIIPLLSTILYKTNYNKGSEDINASFNVCLLSSFMRWMPCHLHASIHKGISAYIFVLMVLAWSATKLEQVIDPEKQFIRMTIVLCVFFGVVNNTCFI